MTVGIHFICLSVRLSNRIVNLCQATRRVRISCWPFDISTTRVGHIRSPRSCWSLLVCIVDLFVSLPNRRCFCITTMLKQIHGWAHSSVSVCGALTPDERLRPPPPPHTHTHTLSSSLLLDVTLVNSKEHFLISYCHLKVLSLSDTSLRLLNLGVNWTRWTTLISQVTCVIWYWT